MGFLLRLRVHRAARALVGVLASIVGCGAVSAWSSFISAFRWAGVSSLLKPWLSVEKEVSPSSGIWEHATELSRELINELPRMSALPPIADMRRACSKSPLSATS